MKRKLFDGWMTGDIRHDVLVRANEYSDGIEIFFIKRDGDGLRYFAKPFKIEYMDNPHEPGTTFPPTPTITLNGDDAIRLQGDLRDIFDFKGLRTKDESRLEGILESQTKHLEDMRKLVFDESS